MAPRAASRSADAASTGWDDGIYSTFGANRIVRFGPGTETWLAGAGDPDPATGAQTGCGPDQSITPEGLAIDAIGSLLYSSGHVVYTLNDPSTAGPWTGTTCSPANIHPGADLSNADLTDIDLDGADLSNLDLTGASLAYSTLTTTNLTGTTLASTTLTSTNFTGATGTPTCVGHGFANQPDSSHRDTPARAH